ncbi:DnaJ family domain-containing protein [Actibacterium pelagium]|nr:DUF1992 domain-containing protein [Actibacterium pelagium]
MKWRELIERQILKAKAEGQLDDLKGAGKPLPPAGHGDASEEAGFRIMAEAGALPKEVELRKALKSHAEFMQTLTDPEERKAAMAEFARLQQELNIQEEARKRYYSSRD